MPPVPLCEKIESGEKGVNSDIIIRYENYEHKSIEMAIYSTRSNQLHHIRCFGSRPNAAAFGIGC